MIEAAAVPDYSADLITQFRADCDVRGMSPESSRRYFSSLRIYAQYLSSRNQDLLMADKNTIKGFLDYLRRERGVGQKTVENYFCALSSFYDFLEYEEHVDKNPINSVRKRYLRRYKDNDDGQVRKLISVEDMAKLIS
jgi:integrase/recombinase XerD